MQELLILRHAEAEPASAAGNDLERPLSTHGEAQAHATGQWVLGHDALPDVIWCSPARRARMTTNLVTATWASARIPVHYPEDIYEASPGQLLALLDQHDSAAADRVLLVGHNPGLERLLALLCQGRSAGFRGMPASALAWIRLDGPLEPGNGRLLAFHTP